MLTPEESQRATIQDVELFLQQLSSSVGKELFVLKAQYRMGRPKAAEDAVVVQKKTTAALQQVSPSMRQDNKHNIPVQHDSGRQYLQVPNGHEIPSRDRPSIGAVKHGVSQASINTADIITGSSSHSRDPSPALQFRPESLGTLVRVTYV